MRFTKMNQENRHALLRRLEKQAKLLLETCKHIVLKGIKCIVVEIPNRARRLIIADTELAMELVVHELLPSELA